jgi:hypothetical protein
MLRNSMCYTQTGGLTAIEFAARSLQPRVQSFIENWLTLNGKTYQVTSNIVTFQAFIVRFVSESAAVLPLSSCSDVPSVLQDCHTENAQHYRCVHNQDKLIFASRRC